MEGYLTGQKISLKLEQTIHIYKISLKSVERFRRLA
jgi:hypothetical protein